jgi:tetratricopeptide (TPR) repeat protein
MMNFLTTGEKIKRLRIQLNLTQEELQTENVTRGLISMIETNKRDVTYATAVKLVDKFNEKAEDLDIILNINEAYLMRSPREDAEVYCMNKLKNEDITQEEINEIFKLSDEYDLLEVRANAYCKLGEIYFKEREFEVACDIYKKAKEIYIDIKKDEKLGYVYWKMGFCKAEALKYTTAIEYYQLSQYYSSEYSDFETKKLCLYSLANSYKKLNEIDLALETIEKFLLVCDPNKDYRLYIFAHGIKATCYEEKREYDKVIRIYTEVLSNILDNKNLFLGYAYVNLGRAYAFKDNYEESFKYFKLAEEFSKESNKSFLSVVFIEKAIILLKQLGNDEAIKNLKLGLKYAEEYNSIEYLLKGKWALISIYRKMNNREKSINIYNEIIEILKINDDTEELVKIYNELAIAYLHSDDIKNCEKYLLLSRKINKLDLGVVS